MQQHTILSSAPLGPCGEAKMSNIIFQLQSQFQRFLKQTLCVFSQISYKTYQTAGLSFGHLGDAPGMGLGGIVGGQGGHFFSEIQTDLVCDLLT